MLNHSISELARRAAQDGVTIGRVVLAGQAAEDGVEQAALKARMLKTLNVMRESVAQGMRPDLKSTSGMTGGQAAKYMDAVGRGITSGGALMGRACARALAVAELNAAMGRIVAAPTAGACGIVPGVLLTLDEEYALGDGALVDALFTAAGVGGVIAQRASISGAEGGCQAECGSAAAMAAAAACQLRGGTPEMVLSAVSLALMGLMGLVCDPVGGLVEVPCVYRNATGVACALSAADMALAGIAPFIPGDEVIDAMGRVGQMMPVALRETGQGGCAACPSARAAAKRIFTEG